MRVASTIVLCLTLVLTGCSLSSTAGSSESAGIAIQGTVHGGQQPIVGSHVYLFAAGAAGYGGTSLSLLTNKPGSTTQDTSGGATNGDYYATTDSNGNFAITGDYTCTPNTQVYIYALGGNPGSGTNSAAGLLAVLGNCPGADNFQTTTPYVVVNEVSTIAAAFAFSGFATDATHVASSGTTLAQTGIQNAFANAANLASLSTGAALATTPAGNGTAPQATVNTLANILASCVNTSGADTGPSNPTACYTLLNGALSGGTTGTAPTETATAAINIAHNSGSNITNLFGLASGTPPFGPALATQPNDFTLGIQFSGGGLNAPNFIAIDGSGNAWITNNGSSSVTEYSASGAALSSSTGYTGGGMDGVVGVAIDPGGHAWIANDLGGGLGSVIELSSTGLVLSGNGYTGGGLGAPNAIAIDGSGNAWITNTGNTVTELYNSGTAFLLSPYTLGGLSNPKAIAIDGNGAAWIANTNNTVTELSSSGTATVLSPYTGGSLDSPFGIAIDHSANAWIANSGNGTLTEFAPLGASVSGSPYSGNLDQPEAVAIDGSGNVWTADYEGGAVSEFSSSGSLLSGANGFGYNAGNILLPDAIAIDGSGNVWVGSLSGTGAAANNGSVTELIGVATPVVTPLSVGVKNQSLGTRP